MLNRIRQSGGGLRRDFALKFVVVALLVAGVQFALDYRNVQRVEFDRVAQQTSAIADSFRIRAELDPAFSLAVATTLADWQVRRRPGLLGVYFVDPKGAVVGQAECEGGADIRQILNNPTIRAGLVPSVDGRPAAGIGVTESNRSVWTHTAPLPKLAVSALVVADLEPARKAIARELLAAATRHLAVLAVLVATLYALMRGVLRPISHLAAAVEQSGTTGRFERPRPMPSNEIGMLATLFGDVFESLRRSTEENEMLAQVANATHAGVLIADGTGKVTWMNAGFERMTGFGRDDILGRMPDENYSRRGQPIGALSALGQGIRFNHGYNVEIADYASDGREFWAAIEVRPIRDEAGAIENFIVIETDITAVKDTEAALNRSQRQLRERVDELQTAKAALEDERAKLATVTKECTEMSNAAHLPGSDTSGTTPAAEGQENGAGKTSLDVLLAEDQPVNQKLMKAVMERLGHRLTIANNGVEALDRLGEQPFDLVLMDIQMPELDGISATKLIRSSDEPWRNIPIVAVTAHTMDGHREAYFAAGMNGFVAKPFKIDVLVAEMARVTASDAEAIGAELQAEQAISGAERSLQREQKAILSAMLDELDSLAG